MNRHCDRMLTINDTQEERIFMKQQTPEYSVVADKDELARECLKLISKIADRGARSSYPSQIGYALQELTQVLLERTGNDDRVFEPVLPNQIGDLPKLYAELEWVNCSAQDLMASARPT